MAPGVAMEIFVGRELELIDEDRNGHEAALRARPAHERQMPFVQGAHGWNEPDRVTSEPARSHEPAQEMEVPDPFHEGVSLPAERRSQGPADYRLGSTAQCTRRRAGPGPAEKDS